MLGCWGGVCLAALCCFGGEAGLLACLAWRVGSMHWLFAQTDSGRRGVRTGGSPTHSLTPIVSFAGAASAHNKLPSFPCMCVCACACTCVCVLCVVCVLCLCLFCFVFSGVCLFRGFLCCLSGWFAILAPSAALCSSFSPLPPPPPPTAPPCSSLRSTCGHATHSIVRSFTHVHSVDLSTRCCALRAPQSPSVRALRAAVSPPHIV